MLHRELVEEGEKMARRQSKEGPKERGRGELPALFPKSERPAARQHKHYVVISEGCTFLDAISAGGILFCLDTFLQRVVLSVVMILYIYMSWFFYLVSILFLQELFWILPWPFMVKSKMHCWNSPSLRCLLWDAPALQDEENVKNVQGIGIADNVNAIFPKLRWLNLMVYSKMIMCAFA